MTVADPSVTAALYARWWDYVLVEEAVLDDALTRSWGASASSGKRSMVLRPRSAAPVHLRLVQGDPVPGYQPLRSYGWAAIELSVQDVLGLHARLRDSPFEIIGPPSAIASLPAIHPMQVRGPDGEIVYLTQIMQGGPGSGLPTARSAVDALFIAVLACADMHVTARWFAAQLGLRLSPEIVMPYRMLNQAFALPLETRHRLMTASSGGADNDSGGDICLEFDQLPPGATERLAHTGQLPPGVSICTVSHPDLSAIPGPWLSAPVRRDGVVYGGRSVGVLRSPEGALIEVVQERERPSA